MLVLQNSNGEIIKAKKTKDMSTESYDYSEHRTKNGTIDGKGYQFHHYNFGYNFYFKYKENNRWYQIVLSPKKEDLHFKIIDKIRE